MSLNDVKQLESLKNQGIISHQDFVVKRNQIFRQNPSIRNAYYFLKLGSYDWFKFLLLLWCFPLGLYLVWDAKEGFFAEKDKKMKTTYIIMGFFLIVFLLQIFLS